MTVSLLVQIDKLVQLLESPVFTCTSSPPLFLQLSKLTISRSQLSASSSSSPSGTPTSSKPCTASSCSFRNRARSQRSGTV